MAIDDEKIPTVVLAGRPNVGKSTLFNRLLRRRRAITDSRPGVTRDPVADRALIGGRPVRLVDTGGFKLDTEGDEGFDAAVRARALEEIQKADVIVLLLAAGDFTPEDEEFISLLRPFADRLVAAVNKTEGGRREAEAWNLLAQGFEQVHMISAEHGDHVGDLVEAIGKKLGLGTWDLGLDTPPYPAQGGGEDDGKWGGEGNLQREEGEGESHQGGSAQRSARVGGADDGGAQIFAPLPNNGMVIAPPHDSSSPNSPFPGPIKIALIGKPNSGKSTLSNALTGSASSLVSEIPGTTRDVLEGVFRWRGADFVVLDTAGIRRRAKVEDRVEYYSVTRAVGAIDEADLVFLVVDAEEGLCEQDKKIAALACERGRGLIIVYNKWDKMEGVKNALAAVTDRTRFVFPQMAYAPIAALSAARGEGLEKLLDTALRMKRQLERRIETSTLNEALGRWLAERPPPVGPVTRFKVRYAVQVSANPVRFVVFASRPGAVKSAYVSYLENKARKELGFSLVPIHIEVRASSKKKPAGGKARGR
jgi:GTP-binding protein